MNNKLKNCKVYSRRMPIDGQDFLVKYGNLMNEENTTVTPLQVWRYTVTVESGFCKQKNTMQWSLTSLGAAVLDERKLDFANGMYGGKWPKYVHYEACNTFYKDSNKTAFLENDSRIVF